MAGRERDSDRNMLKAHTYINGQQNTELMATVGRTDVSLPITSLHFRAADTPHHTTPHTDER